MKHKQKDLDTLKDNFDTKGDGVAEINLTKARKSGYFKRFKCLRNKSRGG